MSGVKIPDFDNLTLDPNGPKGNAWGLFGKGDDLGMLNLLTPEVVAEAAKEIKNGKRFSLDWGFNNPAHPAFGRVAFKHEIINKAPRPVNDDVVSFNTQCSSQWDGFRHYGTFRQGRSSLGQAGRLQLVPCIVKSLFCLYSKLKFYR